MLLIYNELLAFLLAIILERTMVCLRGSTIENLKILFQEIKLGLKKKNRKGRDTQEQRNILSTGSHRGTRG